MTKAEEKPVLLPRFPDVCVRCATCMAACPVSRVTSRFPGPKQAGPGAQRFRSASETSVDDWIELCTSCRLCDTVCPAGVPISSPPAIGFMSSNPRISFVVNHRLWPDR